MRIAVALLMAGSLFGAEPVSVWSPGELKSAAAKLAGGSKITGNTLGAWGGHSASLWKRTASGDAELHKTKADVMVVQEGSATFLSGGSIVGAHPTTAGEIRGSSITGGQSRKIAAGDIVHVPPGTAHQFILEPGQSIVYLAVKIPK